MDFRRSFLNEASDYVRPFVSGIFELLQKPTKRERGLVLVALPADIKNVLPGSPALRSGLHVVWRSAVPPDRAHWLRRLPPILAISFLLSFQPASFSCRLEWAERTGLDTGCPATGTERVSVAPQPGMPLPELSSPPLETPRIFCACPSTPSLQNCYRRFNGVASQLWRRPNRMGRRTWRG